MNTMKIKSGFILREIGGETIAVAVGERAGSFNGMIKLNSTGAFLWHCLENETDREAVVSALTDKYDVDDATAGKSVDDFVSMLKKNGFLDE